MPNLQPLPPTDLTTEHYLKAVTQAWQQAQGRAVRPASHDDDGRAAESGRSGGRLPGQPGQRFALLLLQGLKQAGCTRIDDALRAARSVEER